MKEENNGDIKTETWRGLANCLRSEISGPGTSSSQIEREADDRSSVENYCDGLGFLSTICVLKHVSQQVLFHSFIDFEKYF